MATTREPLASIRNAPGLFAVGFIVVALVVAGLTALLFERNYGLWLGLTAGFQGAAYMWLLKFCRTKASRV
ncbi:MAG: hypothetical protein F4Y16_08860 [Holophagales bacterium]|nr:hypothetical protein [Holophagales bacterium]MYH25185.1 hypothetical protein [Holophagales bacterium]